MGTRDLRKEQARLIEEIARKSARLKEITWLLSSGAEEEVVPIVRKPRQPSVFVPLDEEPELPYRPPVSVVTEGAVNANGRRVVTPK